MGLETSRKTAITKQSREGILVWDYNNDGFDDAVTWGESGVQILMGTETNHLLVQEELSAAFPICERVIVTDADTDGDQDLLLFHGGKVSLAKNEGGNKNHWIDVRVRAEESAQSPLGTLQYAWSREPVGIKIGRSLSIANYSWTENAFRTRSTNSR